MTPRPTAGIPQDIQIASVRREHALLSKQRDVAAESIKQLSDALATLSPGVIVEAAANAPERLLYRVCYALSAVIQVRLLELQMSHENLAARVADLEATLKMADGGDLAALNRAIPQAPSEHAPEPYSGSRSGLHEDDNSHTG